MIGHVNVQYELVADYTKDNLQWILSILLNINTLQICTGFDWCSKLRKIVIVANPIFTTYTISLCTSSSSLSFRITNLILPYFKLMLVQSILIVSMIHLCSSNFWVVYTVIHSASIIDRNYRGIFHVHFFGDPIIESVSRPKQQRMI